MALSDPVFREIQKIAGAGHVTREKEDRICYAFDASGIHALPDAVVFPGSEEEVSRLLALASREKLVVVPRGAGSGMTGGAVPSQGGLVMAFNRMNQILSIDENSFRARVQPGVTVSDLHERVEEKGLFYPPDPSSASVCTIGGNAAECAGGPRAVKYGVTRDYVLGLRAVLPSGDIIQTGVGTAKGVAGYDLTRLIIGSEGTLAVITELTLRLIPLPAIVRTMAVLFESTADAARAVSGIIRAGVIPRSMEYLDEACLFLIRDHLYMDLPKNSRALLIIEVDGNERAVHEEIGHIRGLCTDFKAVSFTVAKNDEEARRLWQARKELSPVMYRIAPHKINEDVVVPIERIPDLVAATQAIQNTYGLKVVSFGHAGDGNIHCNIMYDRTDPDMNSRAGQAVEELFRVTLSLGGTITGEHGIGLSKKKFLPMEAGDTEIRLMKGIKQVFDPLNILNPDKIF